MKLKYLIDLAKKRGFTVEYMDNGEIHIFKLNNTIASVKIHTIANYGRFYFAECTDLDPDVVKQITTVEACARLLELKTTHDDPVDESSLVVEREEFIRRLPNRKEWVEGQEALPLFGRLLFASTFTVDEVRSVMVIRFEHVWHIVFRNMDNPVGSQVAQLSISPEAMDGLTRCVDLITEKMHGKEKD